MADTLSLSYILMGLENVFSLHGVIFLLIGIFFGIIVGATPGMSPAMGVALLVPFSYSLNPAEAFIMFIAAYQASNYGGSITAISINAPGTPASVVTTIDGYALTKKGRAKEALATSLISSVLGGLIGAILLIIFVLPFANFALKFGPAEYFALAFFGITTIITVGEGKWLKTAFGVFFGLFLATIGIDPFSGEQRLTFGIDSLYAGISFIPAMIGLFALGEIFFQIEKDKEFTRFDNKKVKSKISFLQIFSKIKTVILKSSLIGTIIGVIPGAGATIASFVSYAQSKKSDKEFGKGSLKGIAASEAANSSSVGGALVPLLALGIPGSATDAVLIGALSLHNLVAGPELFLSSPEIVYGIFITLLVANILIFIFGHLGSKIWLKIISAPRNLVFSFIIFACMLGSYTLKGSYADMVICCIFGILGWLFKKFGFSGASVVLGLILGIMLESSFRQAYLIGGFTIFVTKPLSLFFIVLALISIIYPFLGRKLK